MLICPTDPDAGKYINEPLDITVKRFNFISASRVSYPKKTRPAIVCSHPVRSDLIAHPYRRVVTIFFLLYNALPAPYRKPGLREVTAA